MRTNLRYPAIFFSQKLLNKYPRQWLAAGLGPDGLESGGYSIPKPPSDPALDLNEETSDVIKHSR